MPSLELELERLEHFSGRDWVYQLTVRIGARPRGSWTSAACMNGLCVECPSKPLCPCPCHGDGEWVCYHPIIAETDTDARAKARSIATSYEHGVRCCSG
jgi:hypothetical protein